MSWNKEPNEIWSGLNEKRSGCIRTRFRVFLGSYRPILGVRGPFRKLEVRFGSWEADFGPTFGPTFGPAFWSGCQMP